MKKNVLLKILTILVIITICLISFIGIFIKNKNQMVNILPDYKLSMNLTGARTIKLAIDESTNEVIYDSEGNVSTDGKNEDGTLKEGYTKKDEKVNPDEVLNSKNYAIVKEIMEKRLQTYGVEEYILKQDNDNGQITLEIPENTDTDEIIYNLIYLGKFEIIDSETEEVLLDNKDVKESKAVYSTGDSGTTVYLSIEFNKDAKKKFEDITKTYISSTDEDGNTTTKKITINLDDEKLLETYFSETITTGLLQLSIGTASTDSETIQSYMKQASQIAALIDNEKMPIKYTIDSNNYIATSINIETLKIVVCSILVILAVALIYLCIKYKLNGVLLSISFIGYIAILLIVLRYTNVVISLEAITAMIALLIANYIFVKTILKKLQDENLSINEAIKQTYIRCVNILFPLIIIAIVFTFIKWIPVASIGMIMFWGLIISFVYNFIIDNTLLDEKMQ